MNTSLIKNRLIALRLDHLPPQILAWIDRDLEGMDDPSLLAILTPKYAVLATRCAIAEMVRRRPAARAPEGDERGRLFTSERSPAKWTR